MVLMCQPGNQTNAPADAQIQDDCCRPVLLLQKSSVDFGLYCVRVDQQPGQPSCWSIVSISRALESPPYQYDLAFSLFFESFKEQALFNTLAGTLEQVVEAESARSRGSVHKVHGLLAGFVHILLAAVSGGAVLASNGQRPAIQCTVRVSQRRKDHFLINPPDRRVFIRGKDRKAPEGGGKVIMAEYRAKPHDGRIGAAHHPIPKRNRRRIRIFATRDPHHFVPWFQGLRLVF